MSATEIEAALRIFLEPGQVSELRALNVRGRKAICEFFNDPAKMAARAAELDSWGASGVYFTPNPLRPDLLTSRKSARKEDVSRRRWLLIDCDPVRPAGVSSSNEELKAAWRILDRCRGELETVGYYSPVVGCSGNGWHLCYQVDMPCDEDTQEWIKSLLKELNRRCGDSQAQVDTSTHDAPRIWKMYGTTARKGQTTPERPHRKAYVVSKG